MVEADLDPTVIKLTQETLGKYVKKPPLTEKLLKKPPFRFLHDVFKAVIKETGYFNGLYSNDELNFENIKDRDDKMRFLQKMIDVIKLTTQRDLNVRTSKIVAGHEPERTNELLQKMGEVIEQQLDWKEAVKKVVTGTTIGLENEKPKNPKKKETKSDGKSHEKSKELTKTKSTKEVRSKESKSSKNATPSPDEKTHKTVKGVSKSKEKGLSRQSTTEKISKATKEKDKTTTKKSKDATDKMKNTNSNKEKIKRISPTTEKPIQNGSHIDKAVNGYKEQQKSIETLHMNGDVKADMRLSNGSLPKQLSKESLNGQSQNELKRRNSKQGDELVSEIPDNPKENLTNETSPKTNSPGSRKSSANHERKAISSEKSRRPSVTKSNSIEQHANYVTQSGSESIQSLKTVNEEGTKVESMASTNNEQTTDIATQPKAVKREPTFTHENSRDSVGSNSNSSITRPRTSLRPPSVRPPSARPGAPRRRDKNVEIILQPNDQIKMSDISVKLETFGDLDDDGENLVIIEDATNVTNIVEESTSKLDNEQLEQQGHLVQQILETQKELTQQNVEVGPKGDKENVETLYDANARQSSARQMNNLRDIIQTLTKSVNPFSKLMDYIPEDIDAMQLELNMWRDTYSQAASDLKRERSLTESATEPMKNQLITIDANIKEYLEMIDASRVKILQNSDKILKMLLEQ